MFNKPRGCISARTDPRHKTVLDYFPDDKRDVLFPIGRLDKDTEGLLILTDDGALCAALLNPEHHIEKEYFFYALGKLDEQVRLSIEDGIKLYPTKDLISRPATVTVDGVGRLADIKDLLNVRDRQTANRRPDTEVFFGRVRVTEGKKHQVKRMLMYGGCRIVYLKRVGMGALSLDPALPVGEYRPLTVSELSMLGVNGG